MEILSGIGLLLLLILLFSLPLFVGYSLIIIIWEKITGRPISPFNYNKDPNKNLKRRIDFIKVCNTLEQKFSFYKKLNNQNKTKFAKRVLYFISIKKFYAKNELILTEEILILISASAVQLTFGLDNFHLNHFERIIIYPSVYYSRTTKKYHKGETNLAGAIVLSWKHFNEGYANENDNLNLGLHEMAHALHFHAFTKESYDYFFNFYKDKFRLLADKDFRALKAKQTSFLRNYAATNFAEFFSVCVEYFFESPAEFKEATPDLFSHLTVLLNLNPLNINSEKLVWEPTKENINTNLPPILDLKNSIFDLTSNLVFVLVIFMFWWYSVISKNEFNFSFLFPVCFSIAIVLIAYFYSKRNIKFYTDGFVINYGWKGKKSKFFGYAEVVLITIVEKNDRYQKNLFKVSYLENQKIIHYNFGFAAKNINLRVFQQELNKLNVPVKYNN